MRSHPFDAMSLISGIVFAVVAGVYLTGAATGHHVDGHWLLPLALIGLGIAGVAGAVTSAARQQRTPATTEVPNAGSGDLGPRDLGSGDLGSGDPE